MNTLVEHARRELAALGEERDLAACLLATVAAYSSFDHSGGSHDAALDMLTRLLRHETLTPLTVDPAEWEDRTASSGVALWQNRRDPRAMSDNRGRTYWYVGDRLARMHTSVLPPAWLQSLQERDELSPDQAETAVRAYLAADPMTDEDLDKLNESDDDEDQVRYMLRRWGREAAPVAWIVYQAREQGAS